MPKREVFYGAATWRDLKFDVVAAQVWLARVGEDDPAVIEMLGKVARGEYQNINNKITDFVVELQRSKHSDNDVAMAVFYRELIGELIQRLDLQKITSDGLELLRKNVNLIRFPEIEAEIDRIIGDRDNALPSK
jgi:hypothetical protein